LWPRRYVDAVRIVRVWKVIVVHGVFPVRLSQAFGIGRLGSFELHKAQRLIA